MNLICGDFLVKNDSFIINKVTEKLEEIGLKFFYNKFNDYIVSFYCIGYSDKLDSKYVFQELISKIGDNLSRPNISMSNDSQKNIEILKGDLDSVNHKNYFISIDILPNHSFDDIQQKLNLLLNSECKLVVKRLGSIDKFLNKYSYKLDFIF